MEQLSSLSPNAQLGDVVKAFILNMQTIQQGTDKLGINLLKRISDNAQVAYTSTSFVQIQPLQSSVKTSGGLIGYFATIPAFMTSAQVAIFELMVDDAIVSTKEIGGNASNILRRRSSPYISRSEYRFSDSYPTDIAIRLASLMSGGKPGK